MVERGIELEKTGAIVNKDSFRAGGHFYSESVLFPKPNANEEERQLHMPWARVQGASPSPQRLAH